MHNESQGSLGSLGGIGHQRDTLGGTACLSITESPALRKQGRVYGIRSWLGGSDLVFALCSMR